MTWKSAPYKIIVFACLSLFWLSCKHTLDPNPNPVPVWENMGPDSVTFNVTVQTQQGIFMVGSYVNMALSQDSLNNNVLVRRVSTDALGRAHFSRLYPRKYYSNCFAYYQTFSLFGSFNIQLPPYAIRDTVLIVH